jgi:hypothetical protein
MQEEYDFIDEEWNLEAGREAEEPEDSEKQVETPMDPSWQHQS